MGSKIEEGNNQDFREYLILVAFIVVLSSLAILDHRAAEKSDSREDSFSTFAIEGFVSGELELNMVCERKGVKRYVQSLCLQIAHASFEETGVDIDTAISHIIKASCNEEDQVCGDLIERYLNTKHKEKDLTGVFDFCFEKVDPMATVIVFDKSEEHFSCRFEYMEGG